MTPQLRVWLYLLVVSATWGSSFLFLKISSAVLPPFALSASRAAVAACSLGLFLLATRRVGVPPGARLLRDGLVLGTTNGWVPNVLTAIALVRIDSALAALLQAAAPLQVAVLAHLVLPGERIRPRGLFGIVLGIGGIALLTGPDALAGATGTLVGGIAMLLTCASYAVGTVYARARRPPDPLLVGMAQQVVSLASALGLALLVEGPSGFARIGEVWLPMLVLGTLGTALPMVLFLRFLSFAPAAQASMVGYLQPVWAGLLGWAVLGERLSPLALLGGAVVLAGVWMVSRK